MKKRLATIALALLVSACTTANSPGMCCKGMMQDGMMKNCPMMKDGGMDKGCCCCKGGMTGKGMQQCKPADAQKAAPVTPAPSEDHKQHH
jgi:hypothetical protein